MTIELDQMIFRFLDTNGNGTGTKNAIGDYSVTPQKFYFKPVVDCDLHRMLIHIEDTTGVTASDYGNINSGLTNGYNILVLDTGGSTVLNLTDSVAIKDNAGIGRYCYDVDVKTWGAGNEMVQARWTFSKAGAPLYLPAGYELALTLNDDMSGLIEHYFMVHGTERR